MANKSTRDQNIGRLRRGRPSLRVPGTDSRLTLPTRAGLLWYAGIGTMAAFEMIDWPLALVVAGTHFIENHARNRDIEQLVEGIEAGL